MRSLSTNGRFRGLALIEVIIVIAVMVVLIGLIFPAFVQSGHPHDKPYCVNNLKQVGLAVRIFANDNEDRFPWQVSTNDGGSREYLEVPNSAFRHFQVMSNELSTPRILVCPEDRKRVWATNWVVGFGNPNVSYFVGFNSSETRSWSRPDSHGSSSVNMDTHCRHEHGIRVMSVPQNIRSGPNAS